MKYNRLYLCSVQVLLVRLLSASFESPATTFAFATFTRTHRRIDKSQLRSSSGISNQDESHFGQGDATSSNTEEHQDAYGRAIKTGTSSDEASPDPIQAAATSEETDTSPIAINLDPLVVCGPSGVGKGTVIESLRKRFPSDVFGFSVSHTTRQPRPGEIHGQHYHFTNTEEIQKDIDEGLFVEHAEVHGNYYGTSKKAIADLQSERKITILDIDMQGVISVKESGIAAKYVFIAPPSMQELEDRLRGRGTETEEAIRKRLGNAAREIEYGETEGNFDHLFVNEDVEKTVDDMVAVLSEWFPQLKTIGDGSGIVSNANDEVANQQQQSPAEAVPTEQPYDFLAESDKMLRFPSVREGHDKLETIDRNLDVDVQYNRAKSNGKHHGYYTVDLEEPEGPRGYPRLGRTNPNIVLDDNKPNDRDGIFFDL